MSFYSALIMITEILMAAMIMHVFGYSGFKKGQKKWYILTFACIMFCAFAEFLVHCGAYDSKFKVILSIITVMQFSLAPLLGILFTGALGLKNQKKIGMIYFGISFLVEAIAAPFGAIFFFDEVGYHRGDLFILYELFYFLYVYIF